ncbi:MAG: hypothetical protein ACKVT0_17345 [Planctomycetaceae bacterium]
MTQNNIQPKNDRVALAHENANPNPLRALVLITWAVCTTVISVVGIFAVFVKQEMIVSAYIAGAISLMGIIHGAIIMRHAGRERNH